MLCVEFGSGEKDFQILSMYPFLGMALHLNKLKFPLRCFAPSLVSNWPNGSGEGKFLNSVNVFLLFHNYLPLERGVVLHLNKIELFYFTQGV